MRTVLIIDDDDDICRLLELMLRKLDCTPIRAKNGWVGVTQAHDHKPDLILLDIMMEDLNGYEVCAMLRTQGYTGRIVLISAIPRSIGQERAREYGADAYVQKPISSTTLFDLFEGLPVPAR